MREYTDVPEMITRCKLLKIRCDICGKESNSDDWAIGIYQILETNVEMSTGTRYPEGGSKETTSFDLCPECFTSKLMPWLESQGAKPTVKEVYF